MSELFEYYTSGDNNNLSIHAQYYAGQTFAPLIAHTIESVRVKLSRLSTAVSVFRIQIKATSGGVPAGPVLASGSIMTSGVGRYPVKTWVIVSLGAGAKLKAGVEYAIIGYSDYSSSNLVWWCDSTSPTYPRGITVFSANFGSRWTKYPNLDTMFQDWGELIEIRGVVGDDPASMLVQGQI